MNVAVVGYGTMGKVLEGVLEEQVGITCVGAVEPQRGETLSDLRDKIDVIIDFSNPINLKMIEEFVALKPCAVVIATTGYTSEQTARVTAMAQKIPVVFAANFSLGVTVMKRVLAEITPILEGNFDMEMVEKHHNKKLDAPSGTAKMLVNAMNPAGAYELVYGREGNGKRGKEIGIHALRGGTIAGEHTAIYAGEDEILEIKHTALSKKIFAVGAVKAAIYACGKKAGLYDMENVLFG